MAKLVLPHALGNAAATWNTRPRGLVTLSSSMCSASQPSSRAITDWRCAARTPSWPGSRCRRTPSRTTRSRASRGSARCTSCRCTARRRPTSPGASGRADACARRAPTRCPGGSARARPMPIRVMMPMLTTTYGRVGDLHAEPRERAAERSHRERDDVHRAAAHAPANSPSSVSRISGGSRPVVGRAGVVLASREQMKVRDSTRATSSGCAAREEAVRAVLRVEPGDGAGLDHAAQQLVLLARDPSHQTTVSGVVSARHLLDPGDDLAGRVPSGASAQVESSDGVVVLGCRVMSVVHPVRRGQESVMLFHSDARNSAPNPELSGERTADSFRILKM